MSQESVALSMTEELKKILESLISEVEILNKNIQGNNTQGSTMTARLRTLKEKLWRI